MKFDFLTIGFTLLLICTLVYFVLEYNKKNKPLEKFSGNSSVVQGHPCDSTLCESAADFPLKPEMTEDNYCGARDKLSAEDLLPKDAANSKWSMANPAGQGDVNSKNFLNSGYHVGIDTQASSLRNSNLQLRSEPINPQSNVSPWMNTTIDPDLNRRPLEIGESSD